MSDVAKKLLNYFENNGLSQKEVAEKLGTSTPYVNAILNGRKSIGKKQAVRLENLFGLSSSWLLTGYGEMLKSSGDSSGKDVAKRVAAPTADTMELPLVPIDAMAGALDGSDMSFMEYECEKYVVPIFKGADFLIRVQGDSMVPTYASGDIVACQRVLLDRLWFQWGKAYVVSTSQGPLVKRIEPSDKEGFVSIHSDNGKYRPFDLPVEEINGVALVKGIIRVE